MENRKKISIGIVIFCLLFGCTGCVIPEIMHNITEEKREEQEIPLKQEELLYGYQTLSKEEQGIYREIVSGIEHFDEELTLSPVTKDELIFIFNRVMIDHPEYFWTEGAYQYYEDFRYDGTVRSMKVIPEYLMSQEEAEQTKSKIEEKAKEWMDGISPDASTYEKIKYLYEKMILEIPYEDDSVNNQNIQSVFLDGSTVCMGYSKAFQYLLNKMGIFCTLVTGNVVDGSDDGHAWNLVKIDEEYYYVDVTWGNPGHSKNMDAGVDVYYSYLCCNDAVLAPSHKANDDIPLPVCVDDRYNYYKMKGCWYETFSYDDIYNYLKNEISSEYHVTELCFGTKEAYDRALQELLNGTVIEDVIQNSDFLLPGQEISWQISYGGWDYLIVIRWN